MSFNFGGGGDTNPNGDLEVGEVQGDTISSIAFSPTHNIFVAGSWNKEVRCWEVGANGQTQARAMMKHEGPVLDVCWHPDGTKVFTASCDKSVKMWQPAQQGNAGQQVAAHDAPVKTCHWAADVNLLVTGSWDKTLRFWDLKSPKPAGQIQLPERCYCVDVKSPLLVVGTAERAIQIFDVRKPTQPFRQLVSPLKFQSRCVSAFSTKNGFALGSIEGRVAIQYADEKDSSKNFAFKCHRQNAEIYAVNSICFHPQFGTFSTAGSDGTFNFWDKDSKQRLKSFKRMPQPITTSSFNRDGTIFAYATGYDWSKGYEGFRKDVPPRIFLHAVKQAEVAPRKK